MEIYVFLLVGFCSITSTLTATAFAPATVHQSHPSECYVANADKYYSAGESWQIQGCAMATCNWSNFSGSPQLILSYQSCGVVSADPPCYVTEDLTLPYPACCPEPVCPENEESKDSSEHAQNSENSELAQESAEAEPEPVSDRTESDFENEVDDTVSIISDPKYFSYYADSDSIFSQLHSNDLSSLTTKFPSSHDNRFYDFRFQERKVPQRFAFAAAYPKFLFHWLF